MPWLSDKTKERCVMELAVVAVGFLRRLEEELCAEHDLRAVLACLVRIECSRCGRRPAGASNGLLPTTLRKSFSERAQLVGRDPVDVEVKLPVVDEALREVAAGNPADVLLRDIGEVPEGERRQEVPVPVVEPADAVFGGKKLSRREKRIQPMIR